MSKIKIVEITKDNYSKYLNQIVELEKVVLNKMENEGQEGQFFTTGYDDILEYIKSKENTVIVAADEHDTVLAATYITEGQTPYTYNDITKYFKNGKKYSNWVRSQYDSEEEYKRDMIDAYKQKLDAYKEAKKRVLEENPQYTSISDFLKHEINEPENKFHEKSILRNNLNKYMSKYIKQNGDLKLYERFYWTTSEDIAEAFNKETYKNEDVEEYEFLLQRMNVDSIEEPEIENIAQYYSANTNNSVEIDTYITDPNSRASGLAKIIVYEGIKKHITNHFNKPEENEIFLCSTLHRQNVSSKYVSEFFGLKDSLFVNRRFGRTREVHITRILRGEATQYLNNMYNKLAVLNAYNPENREIPKDTVLSIYREEKYRKRTEAKRLLKLSRNPEYNKKYKNYLRKRIIGMMRSGIKINKAIKEYNETR